MGGFVEGVVREVSARERAGARPRREEWQECFVEFFIRPPCRGDSGCPDADDLLFFVRDGDGSDGPDGVFVKRKVEDADGLPALDGPVRWEETFHVNLIARLRCHMRATVCRRDALASGPDEMLVVNQVCRRVFAEPAKCASGPSRTDTAFECSFPFIYFSIHGLDESFDTLCISPGETLCVELRAVFGGDDAACGDGAGPSLYRAWEADGEHLPLFQGAVSYAALGSVYRRKRGLVADRPQAVLMRGPAGKGDAQVEVADVLAGSRDSLEQAMQVLKAGIRRISLRAPSEHLGTLRCRLFFVKIHWRLVVLDLFRHFATRKGDDP